MFYTDLSTEKFWKKDMAMSIFPMKKGASGIPAAPKLSTIIRCAWRCILWISLFVRFLFLDDGADRIGHVDAFFAIAFGERLDELVLDHALMVKKTRL